MANYPTSSKKPSLKRTHHYVVTYEDCQDERILTFGVWAHSASEATARVITFIAENKLHTGGQYYALIPRVSFETTHFTVN